MRVIILQFCSLVVLELLNPILAQQCDTVSRVVSLVPSVTEIICAIGAQDKLVGVVTPCDYPPGINLPIVGSFSFPNLERIVALKPDIVFVTGVEQKYLLPKLKELGLRAVLIAPESLDEIYSSIIEIGELLGKSKEADSLVAKLKEEFEEIRKISPQKISPNKRRRVFIEISDNPLITCGKGSFLDELITHAQARNITHHINKPYPIVSSEFIVKANPDVIIVVHPISSPEARLGWENINAVKNNRIYSDIDPNLICRPGPRVIEGIRELKKRIYPELFEKR